MKPAHNEYLFIEELRKGYFRIDNEGRIWRIAIKHPSNEFLKIPKREMKHINNAGYIQIRSRINGKDYSCLAHRIIWIYFNGEIPDGFEINHKNGIKTANWPENLELSTKSENLKHAHKTGLKQTLKGEELSHSKLTNKDVKEIRLRHSQGETQTSIAKEYNIGQQHVSKIVNRKTWKHIK